MSQADSQIIALAKSSTGRTAPTRFHATGEFVAEGEPIALVGNLGYANAFMEIRAAIQVGSWVFCIERSRLPELAGDEKIGGFFNGGHYTFADVARGHGPANTQLLTFVMSAIMPIVLPDQWKQWSSNPNITFGVKLFKPQTSDVETTGSTTT